MAKTIYNMDETTVKFKYLLSLLVFMLYTLQPSYNGVYLSVRLQAIFIRQAEDSYFI